MVTIGSHNTMTYLKPKHWWMRLFSFMYKCQDKTIEQQLREGIRNFDIRIAIDKYFHCYFAHGLVKFVPTNENEQIHEIFKLLNSVAYREKSVINVRLIFEESYHNKYTERKTQAFIGYAQRLITNYGCLNIYELRRKYDWKNLIPYGQFSIDYEQFVSSMNGKWYNSWLPRIFAKKYNKIAIEYTKTDKVLFIDFVNQYN